MVNQEQVKQWLPAIAKSLGKKIILINYGDIESKYVAKRQKILNLPKQMMQFFDEADAILSRRVTNMTSATDTSVKPNAFCHAYTFK